MSSTDPKLPGPMWSAEFQAMLDDGGEAAVQLVLAEALKRGDAQMVARLMSYLNVRNMVRNEPAD